MASEQIREFLLAKKARADASDIDWAARRDEWIRAVDALYDEIERRYLGQDDLADVVSVDRSRSVLVEEKHAGSYTIGQLRLSVGDEEVFFTPKGMNVVGANGRVDVWGDRGESALVWEADGRWAVVLSRAPRLQKVALNDDSFLALLQGVMR